MLIGGRNRKRYKGKVYWLEVTRPTRMNFIKTKSKVLNNFLLDWTVSLDSVIMEGMDKKMEKVNSAVFDSGSSMILGPVRYIKRIAKVCFYCYKKIKKFYISVIISVNIFLQEENAYKKKMFKKMIIFLQKENPYKKNYCNFLQLEIL